MAEDRADIEIELKTTLLLPRYGQTFLYDGSRFREASEPFRDRYDIRPDISLISRHKIHTDNPNGLIRVQSGAAFPPFYYAWQAISGSNHAEFLAPESAKQAYEGYKRVLPIRQVKQRFMVETQDVATMRPEVARAFEKPNDWE